MMTRRNTALAMLAALSLTASGAAMAQGTATDDPAMAGAPVEEEDDDSGKWGLLGLLGLAGLLGMKRRDDDRDRRTTTTGTGTTGTRP
jgi:hypothetical protein